MLLTTNKRVEVEIMFSLTNPGEYINLYFGESFRSELYVAGHVDFFDGVSEIQRMEGNERWFFNRENKKWIKWIGQVSSCKHTYGRWTPNVDESTNCHMLDLNVCEGPARGAFPITEFQVSHWYAPISIA